VHTGVCVRRERQIGQSSIVVVCILALVSFGPDGGAGAHRAKLGCYNWVVLSEVLGLYQSIAQLEPPSDTKRRRGIYQDLVGMGMLTGGDLREALTDARQRLRAVVAETGEVSSLVDELRTATRDCEAAMRRKPFEPPRIAESSNLKDREVKGTLTYRDGLCERHVLNGSCLRDARFREKAT